MTTRGHLVKGGCLLGRERMICRCWGRPGWCLASTVKGLQEAFHRGVHGLAAFDHGIGPHFPEGFREAFAGGHGNRSQGFAAAFETLFHVVLVVLEGHVLHLDGEELAPFAAFAENGTGVLGVHVYLDDAAVAEEHKGVSLGGQPVLDYGFSSKVSRSTLERWSRRRNSVQ